MVYTKNVSIFLNQTLWIANKRHNIIQWRWKNQILIFRTCRIRHFYYDPFKLSHLFWHERQIKIEYDYMKSPWGHHKKEWSFAEKRHDICYFWKQFIFSLIIFETFSTWKEVIYWDMQNARALLCVRWWEPFPCRTFDSYPSWYLKKLKQKYKLNFFSNYRIYDVMRTYWIYSTTL